MKRKLDGWDIVLRVTYAAHAVMWVWFVVAFIDLMEI